MIQGARNHLTKADVQGLDSKAQVQQTSNKESPHRLETRYRPNI